MPSKRHAKAQAVNARGNDAEEVPPTAPEPAAPTPQLSTANFIDKLATPTALLSLAAISSPISQATLAPVFGALPSAVNHREAVIAAAVLAFTLRYFFPGVPKGLVGKCVAAWAFWVPVLQCYLFSLSGALGPKGGPALLGFLSCHCILIPTVYAAAEAIEDLHLKAKYGKWYGTAVPAALGIYYLVTAEQWFQANLPNLTLMSSMFVPVTMQLVLAVALAFFAPSSLLLASIPALVHTLYLNPHFQSEPTTTRLNRTLQTHNWTLLDRAWSNSGYLSVIENLDTHYRMLRCDHSFLGGEWLLTPERQQNEGWTVNEPVFPVFEMLEAVRLMDLQHTVPDAEATALVIGLGIGTAPKAFLSHGIDTTIVELDPKVYEYAVKYFDLPITYDGYITDAQPWVESAALNQTSKFDYIVHDVFTGGAEPLALFTETFLANLRSLLQPHGAFALNYAGDLTLPLTARVLNTIDKTFDGHCKAYRDNPAEAGGSMFAEGDFTNMVIFCRNTPGSMTFRTPSKSDFLGSKSRENYLLPKPELEFPFPLRNSDNRSLALQDEILRVEDVATWSHEQAESAIRHWHIMRKIVPDAIWELW